MLSNIIKGSFLTVMSRGIDIVFFLLLVRVLGKEDMGVYNHLFALSAFFYLWFDLGFVTSFSRDVCKNNDLLAEKIPHVASRFAIGLLVFSIAILYARWQGIASSVIAFMFSYQLISFIKNILLAVLKAQKKVVLSNTFVVSEAAIKLVLLSVLMSMGAVVLVFTAAILFVAGLSVCMCLVYVLRQSIVRYRWFYGNRSPYFCAATWRFFLIALITLIQNRLDWMLIQYYLDFTQLAEYSVARRLYEYSVFLVTVPLLTAVPWIYENVKINYSIVLKVACLGNALSAIYFLCLVAAFPILNELIWQNKYSESQNYVVNLGILVIGSQVMVFYYHLAIALGKESMMLLGMVAVTLVQLFVNIVMIPSYGVWGAIIALIVMNTLNVIFYVCIIRVYSHPLAYSFKLLHSLTLFLVIALWVSLHFFEKFSTWLFVFFCLSYSVFIAMYYWRVLRSQYESDTCT